MSVGFIYCETCGLVRNFIDVAGMINQCDCGSTVKRVIMSNEEFDRYEPFIIKHGFIEFMKLYNSDGIEMLEPDNKEPTAEEVYLLLAKNMGW